MRKVAIVVILLLSLLVPVKRLDASKLQPVEAVAVYVEDGRVVLETDTEDKGSGNTALEALENMKANALSVIYLDTAEYLLVEEGAGDFAEALRPLLSGSVKVGKYLGGSVKDQVAYYEVHGKLPKLKSWNGGK